MRGAVADSSAELTLHSLPLQDDPPPTVRTELTLAQVMLPEDANPRGNVHGGTLMKLADSAGGVCATPTTRDDPW